MRILRDSIKVFTFCLALTASVAPVHATPPLSFEQPRIAAPDVRPKSELPRVLGDHDLDLYRQIFAAGEQADWAAADALIAQLQNPILVGHALAQRYQHAYGYQPSLDELSRWLGEYGDVAEATNIYALATRLNRRRGSVDLLRPATASLPSRSASESALLPVSMQERQAAAEMRAQLADRNRDIGFNGALALAVGDDGQMPAFDDNPDAAVVVASPLVATQELSSRRSSGGTDATWNAGLAAWRANDFETAASHFEAVANSSESAPWTHAAAAFWAARSYLYLRQPTKVNPWLASAAVHPQTFYGLLARRVLGMPMPFDWSLSEQDRNAVAALSAQPAGRRALALLEIGRPGQAEGELRLAAAQGDIETMHGAMIVADNAGMAQLAMRLQKPLAGHGIQYVRASYPVPNWQPLGGFTADRALVYALIRQESTFNPKAVSPVGARGLMQLMPATARFVARTSGTGDADPSQLHRPDVNLALGQRYIEMLMSDGAIGGDLFRFAVAWNGGPGNLGRWDRRTGFQNDPLLFIESIPAAETRTFIERVLANLWIYRDRFGESLASLDSLAAGAWPGYDGWQSGPVDIAEHGQE